MIPQQYAYIYFDEIKDSTSRRANRFINIHGREGGGGEKRDGRGENGEGEKGGERQRLREGGTHTLRQTDREQ